MKRRIPDPDDPAKQVEAVTVRIAKSEEPFCYFTLEDGTELTLRTIVTEVLRLVDKWDEAGRPMYKITSQATITIASPEDLDRPSC